MTARRADLSCVVVAETARPVQHQARVLGTFTVLNEDRMPAAAVWAVQLVAWLQRMCMRSRVREHLDVGGHVPYRVVQPWGKDRSREATGFRVADHHRCFHRDRSVLGRVKTSKLPGDQLELLVIDDEGSEVRRPVDELTFRGLSGALSLKGSTRSACAGPSVFTVREADSPMPGIGLRHELDEHATTILATTILT